MAKKKLTTQVRENVVQSNEEKIKQKRLVPTTALKALELTETQKRLLQIIEENKIIIISGPAGTGKTLISCYYAIKSLINHTFDKIVFSKPIEESGERLGFLPGDMASKIDPYLESYKGNILKFINKQTYEKLIAEDYIKYKPLAYLRGVTMDDSFMVLDECQNADLRQIMLFVSRMGKGSKVILSGDTRQSDISNEYIGLKYFSEMVGDIKGIAHFEFNEEDIMRDPILKEITKRYENSKVDKSLPKNKK